MSALTPPLTPKVNSSPARNNMHQPTLRTTDVVTSTSCLTYIELTNTNYDEFRDELDQMHGQMQYSATNSTAHTYTKFEGQVWWYCISQIPSSWEVAGLEWYGLNGPGAYQAMLNIISNTLDTENITLELTNNIPYVASDMTLPISEYPRTILDGQEEPAIIYPAYFTLKPTPIVQFPPAIDNMSSSVYKPPPQAYNTLNRLQLNEFGYDFPPGLQLQPQPISTATTPTPQHRPTSPIHTIPTSHPRPLPKTPTPYTLPATPAPLTLFPMTALPTPPTLPTSPLAIPIPILPTPSRSSTKPHPHPPHEPPQNQPRTPSLTLLDRPAKHITRRYSLPFDARITGLGHPSEIATLPKKTYFVDSIKTRKVVRHVEPTNHEKPRVTFGEAPYVKPGSSVFEERVGG
ncbi:hypothetical protein PMZ80_004878 [Knufia obscura]|uniref:Uncharacterized protein n=1 Tax=Knufia obscura TaxID=1635080 RepID=A0ABR0RNY9_9EURO|nr:hypothetical protein PMZ80_004878 [Knufia obscura]